MIEAGADEIPEDEILEAFELAHAEIVKICEAQEELREPGRQAEVPRPRAHGRARVAARRPHPRAHPSRGPARGRRDRRGADSTSSLPSSTWTRRRRTSSARSRSALAGRDPREGSARGRRAARPRAVRERPRALTEAEQDSKELKSAKRQLLFDRIVESVELPFPVGPATVDGDGPVVKDSLTKQFVKKAAEAIYKQLVRQKIAVDKRRPDGRGAEDVRDVDCEVGVAPRTHGSASSRAARRRS